jgi:hypothetical protein
MLAGYHPYGRRPANASRESEIALQPLAALDPERRAALRSALAWSRSGRPSMAELVRALRRDHIETPIAPPAPVIAVTPAAIAARLAAESPAAVPVLAVAAAVPAVPAGPTKLRVTLLSAVAAGLALVLGILIGRFDSGTPQPVAPASPPAASIAAVAAPTVQEGNVALAAAVAAAPVATVTEDAAPEAAGAEGTSGLVFFDAPKMIVSKRAVVAALPLRHLNHARRAVRVNWRIVDGTALAGRDYAGPSSGIETFVEGHSFRILYVPIVANPGATRDRTFTVELTDVTPGASFGPTPSVEVTILGGP